ncbi:MAG: trypsin-like peptidase domain-containing protein [Chloroflexota bacterium]
MKSDNKLKLILLITVLLLVGLACQSTAIGGNATNQALLTENNNLDNNNEAEEAVENIPVVDLVSQEDALISVYQDASSGVVAILIYAPGGAIPISSGSGFVIDLDGHIVTNYHVVETAVLNGLEVQIAFTSGIKTRAQVIGVDEDSDLAVIKVDVDPEELNPLPLGDSTQLNVGQIVVAIGNPFGLNGSLTTGVVSSIGRTLDSLNQSLSGQYFAAGDIIQTDAAINPGNSGGPLLNLNGEVIGVNRAIQTFNTNAADQPVNSGIGFAVSINIVKRVIPSLLENGSFEYPYLGISSWSDFPLAEAERLGLEKTLGAGITNVTEGGPADQAGLQVDDVILEIDGVEVLDFSTMISYLFNFASPGDTVELTVFREGELITVEMVIGARP